MVLSECVAATRARLARGGADAALSDGSDPTRSPVLAARARQLTTARARRSTAVALERLALSAQAPPSRTTVRPSRTATASNRRLLLELAGELRSGRAVYAAGVASLQLVIRDGTGPAYTDRHGEWLAAELHRARRRLYGEGVAPDPID